jgi:hypothetical protein
MMNFEGVIGEIDLIQRLVDLGREGFTGAIRFENDGVIKIVYFKGGDVLSASTNDRTDSIDEILLRAGKVTREHVKQALAKRKESETLGDALLGLGFITRKELTWARRVQVIGILRGVLGWPAGSYTIVADYLPKREEGTIFPLNQILVELVVTDQDRQKFEQAMESGGAVFALAPAFDEGFRKLGLNEDAEQIVSQIDGQRSAAEVAGASGKDVFNVYKLLEALRVLGLVEKREGVTGPGANFDDFAAVGAADATDAWKLEDDVPPPPTPEPPAPEPAMPSWDMPATTVSTRSVWDEPDEPALAPPPDQTIELAMDEPAGDHQWGFDEAQIEAARRAAVPMRSHDEIPPPPARAAKPPAPPRRSGALVVILLLVILGAGGWYGWTWWQGRAAHSVASATPPPPVRRAALTTMPEPVPAPPATSTTTTTTTTAEVTDTSKPLPTVQRRAPAPAPTPVPAPAPAPASGTRIERTTTGSPTITNAPAGGGAGNALQQRYAAMARDFAAKPGGAYTVQFELVCETASVTKALRDGGANVWFVTTTYRGRPCYRVFWGRYDDLAAATAAAKTIPSSLAGSKPVVVKVPR